MTLAAIVRALGGELYDGGRRATVPGPGHGPEDRSVSLLLTDGRVVVHSFGRSHWAEILDDLRTRGLVDPRSRPTEAVPITPSRTPPSNPAERSRRAVQVWSEGRPVGRSLALTYLRRRGVLRPNFADGSLRFHDGLASAVYAGVGRRRPALLAAVRTPGDAVCGLEITYLDSNGTRACDLRTSRKTIGAVLAGSAVRLDPADHELLVGEGVVTTLSAADRFSLPSWALLSAQNLRTWVAPAGVDRVVIAADRDAAGQAAARGLAERLLSAGREVRVETPPAPFGDWNEARIGGSGTLGELGPPRA